MTAEKILVKDLSPELYRRLRKWNYRENGRMQNLYTDARKGKFEGPHYVVLIKNAFGKLIGHSLTFFYTETTCDSHFYIGQSWRGQGYGKLLMKATISVTGDIVRHEVETHDERSEYFFEHAQQQFGQKINII